MDADAGPLADTVDAPVETDAEAGEDDSSGEDSPGLLGRIKRFFS